MGQSNFMINKSLRVFELQVENVGEVREHMCKRLTIGRVGAQCCPVCCVGLWNQTFSIFLQQLFIACCFHILFLNLCELLLQMPVECLLRFGPLFRCLCDLSIYPPLARKAHIEGEHVVVPIFTVGVLVHVTNLKVWL